MTAGRVAAAALVSFLASGPLAAAPRGCIVPPAAQPIVDMPSRAHALALLGSVTQLGGPLGKPVLESNFATSVAINNTASAAQRARALQDAQVTANAHTLADGLGDTMGRAYREAAAYASRDDGRRLDIGHVSPETAALFTAATTLTGGDSAESKCAFANGSEPYQKGLYKPPAGGVLDVLGKAYGHGDPGAPGNPRPFLTAPLDATSGPRIATFAGTDFFGAATNSRLMLMGASDADRAAGRTGSDLRDSPSYPSGHTTFGYTEALLLAMMVPERYRALVYRASEYGNSRIVLGAHYPIDVIGGRTLATYDLAQALAGKASYAAVPSGSFQDALAAAATTLRAHLKARGCPDIAVCAREPILRAEEASILDGGQPKAATPAAAYRWRLDYGLAPMGSTTVPPEVVPVAAGFLLQSRFPYLTVEQRSDILRSTEGPSGHFLDVDPTDGMPIVQGPIGPNSQAGPYARLDLFAAAGGYASFSDRVVVEQDPTAIVDPNLRPFADFARADTWTNDIGGSGGLTKRGSGRLTLAGVGTFGAPSLVEGGTLEVAGSVVAPTNVEAGGTLAGTGRVGEVFVLQGGALAPGAPDGYGTLAVSGSLSLAQGSSLVVGEKPSADGPLVRTDGHAIIDAAALIVKAPLKPGTRLTLIAAKDGIIGRFETVRLDDPSLDGRLDYSSDRVTLTAVAKDSH